LIFNLDILSDLELFTDQEDFIKFLKERISKEKLFVFVDEAQRVKNAGIFFKGVYDLNLPVKLVLTGSSSLEIRAKIHESLTGRKRLFHLYPFSFQEYLSTKDKTLEELIQGVYDMVGEFKFERIDLHLKEEQKLKIVANCKANFYKKFGDLEVRRVENIDGFKYFFDNDEWVMIRASGTEPVLRTYAEAATNEAAFKILERVHKEFKK